MNLRKTVRACDYALSFGSVSSSTARPDGRPSHHFVHAYRHTSYRYQTLSEQIPTQKNIHCQTCGESKPRYLGSETSKPFLPPGMHYRKGHAWQYRANNRGYPPNKPLYLCRKMVVPRESVQRPKPRSHQKEGPPYLCHRPRIHRVDEVHVIQGHSFAWCPETAVQLALEAAAELLE